MTLFHLRRARHLQAGAARRARRMRLETQSPASILGGMKTLPKKVSAGRSARNDPARHHRHAAFLEGAARDHHGQHLLSGDNAVVIALAARNLPARQQTSAVFLGSAAAIVLRVILTLFAVQLLQLPYLKLAGGLLLIWIGAKMLVDEEGDDSEIAGSDTLIAAVGTILFADLVMSVDNVIAVAAAAETGPPPARLLLLIIGLGLSIPLIIIGAQLLMKLMTRWPIIITLGAALLGYVAGEMAITDSVVAPWCRRISAISTRWLHSRARRLWF